MGFAQQLWEENRDLATQALEHPFVQGLGKGTLPPACFQSYVGQDAYFLEAYARAYALGLAYSPEQKDWRVFYELLAGVLKELELHEGYAREWGLRLDDVEPMDATLAYTDFLQATAALRGVALTCIAMTPCMRLYAYLGQTLFSQGSHAENPYRHWLENYASPEVEDLTQRLEALVDRYAQDIPAAHETYRRAMKLELAFFSAHISELS